MRIFKMELKDMFYNLRKSALIWINIPLIAARWQQFRGVDVIGILLS